MHFLYVPVTTSQNGPPRVAPPEAAVKENAELALTQDSMEADVKDVWIKIINAGLHKCTVSLVCVCVCVKAFELTARMVGYCNRLIH